jgi:membrane dipeptidase
MSKRKIAIVGWNVGDNSFGVTLAYIKYFSKLGDVTIITPTETTVREGIDLLVLPGGPDVDPMRYLDLQDALDFEMGKQCPFRERFDKVLLPLYIKERIPIFGICRGHQSLAVYFGGKLRQDMYHDTNPYNDRSKLMHTIKYTPNSSFFIKSLGLSAASTPKVNSIHHQTVSKIPKNALCIAICGTDSEVEAIGYLNYPAYTVQWHPEEIDDTLSEFLLYDLLESETKGVSTLMKLSKKEELC